VVKGLEDKNDETGKNYAGSFCLVPVENGVQEIGGGSVEVIVEMSRGFFSMNSRKRLLFPYKKISVIPIPAEGKPETFKGDVGEFKIEAQLPAGSFKEFEEIKVPVKVLGRGNLLTLSKPQTENEDGIKTVVEEKEQTLSVRDGSLTGEKNFLVTIIPQAGGVINPGRIFIEYFNPYKKKYERTESLPLSFNVQKSTGSGDNGEVQFAPDAASTGKFNYFVAAIIVAGLVFTVIALVFWERKKLWLIKSELKTDTHEEDENLQFNKNKDILNNMRIALKENNRELFLLNADRGIGQVNIEKLSRDEEAAYNLFKEKIYFCRYGGGLLEESEMMELSDWLKKILK